MTGLQLGVFNQTKHVEGKGDNAPSVKSFGMQIGIVNNSRTNNGIQIGIINRAKRMRGTQIGLINFFIPGPYDGSNRHNGTPVGLLNIGTKDSRFRIASSDILPLIVEFTTGNCKNCTFSASQMPYDDIFYKSNQNALIFGYSFEDGPEMKWAIGYGFHKVYYNKSSVGAHDVDNKRFFFSPSIRLIHLNRSEQFDPSLSLISQIQLETGYRVGFIAFFAGINMNAFYYEYGDPLEVSLEIASRQSSTNYQIWPGYVIGVQL